LPQFASHAASQCSPADHSALLVLAANAQLTTDTGRVVRAVGLSCVGVSLLVLFSALVNALRSLRDR
jgi:hypothetical protein